MTIEISNCCECPWVRKEHDSDPGLDGYTKLFYNKTGEFLRETKTRWLAIGRSYVDIPDSCPFNDNKQVEE